MGIGVTQQVPVENEHMPDRRFMLEITYDSASKGAKVDFERFMERVRRGQIRVALEWEPVKKRP